MFDRSKQSEIPQLQLNFIDKICGPVYKVHLQSKHTICSCSTIKQPKYPTHPPLPHPTATKPYRPVFHLRSDECRWSITHITNQFKSHLKHQWFMRWYKRCWMVWRMSDFIAVIFWVQFFCLILLSPQCILESHVDYWIHWCRVDRTCLILFAVNPCGMQLSFFIFYLLILPEALCRLVNQLHAENLNQNLNY